MNAIAAVFQFAMAHPIITVGIVGGAGYGVYKLADKGIDTANSVANHAIDRALDNKYSFEFKNVSIKAYPQGHQTQTLPATC